mmetsp:Transcript_11931/g.25655  ORF Transcript_11931/g.25655 Transcript_11931/m.25655 type:complete len:106 (+) Transcript_11931:223-540(+)
MQPSRHVGQGDAVGGRVSRYWPASVAAQVTHASIQSEARSSNEITELGLSHWAVGKVLMTRMNVLMTQMNVFLAQMNVLLAQLNVLMAQMNVLMTQVLMAHVTVL